LSAERLLVCSVWIAKPSEKRGGSTRQKPDQKTDQNEIIDPPRTNQKVGDNIKGTQNIEQHKTDKEYFLE